MCVYVIPCLATAQSEFRNFDIAAGAGLISGTQINIDLSSERGPIMVDQASPIYFISGKYFFRKGVALGLTIATQNITGYSNSDWTAQNYTSTFAYSMNALTIAPELTFAYVRRKNFMFYSVIGVAYVHNSVSYSYIQSSGGDHYKIDPNSLDGQYTPLGFRFGDAFSAFIELGYGYKGVLNGGLSCRITKKKQPR